MNYLRIRSSDIKGPLNCVQPHPYMNLKYSNKETTIQNLVIGEQLVCFKRRYIGSFSTDTPATLKKPQNLFFYLEIGHFKIDLI